MNITVTQYKAAVAELSDKHREILKTLYYFPDAKAGAKQLALALGYKSYQGANRHVGEIGKRIGMYLGIKFETYYDNRSGFRAAYYKVVGPWTNDGWEMWPNLQKALLALDVVEKRDALRTVADRLSTEIQSFHEQTHYKEGKVVQIYVNRYERSFLARQKCLDYHGRICMGCDLDMEVMYGKIAEGYIHVHHRKSLREISTEYVVDPVEDLVPLCPNCHAVVHLSNPVLSVEKLRKLIRQRKR